MELVLFLCVSFLKSDFFGYYYYYYYYQYYYYCFVFCVLCFAYGRYKGVLAFLKPLAPN